LNAWVFIAVLAWSLASQASSELCVADAEAGQARRREGRLLDARDAFGRCAQTSCPALVRADCQRWLAELEAVLAAVVVDAEPLTAQLTIDGRMATFNQPVPVVAGPHVVRVEAAGFIPFQSQVECLPGRTDRLKVTLLRDSPTVMTPPPRQQPVTPPRLRVGAVVLTVGAVLAWGVGAVFGVMTQQRFAVLNQFCAGRCAESQVAPVRGLALAADVTLLGALVASVASVLGWALPGRSP
jgi:hypothetical protein